MKLSEYLKKNNMTTEEYFERQKRRSKGVTTLTDYRRDKKNSLSQTINFDTFEADLNSMGTTIQGIYDGWQTQDTMSKTKTTVEAMQARINAYQDYQKMFGGADLSELASSYNSVHDNWDNVSTMYSQYKDADSYNVAKKNAMFDEQFKGLTYGDVQSKLKEYATDSDEYKYLSGYTNYSDLNDFDEALKNATGDYKFKLQKIRNQYALDNKFDLYKEMYYTAYYSLRNEHDVDDVISETILDAFSSIKKLRNEEAFKAWIFKILSAKIKRKQSEYANTPSDIDEPEYQNMFYKNFEYENVELAQAMDHIEDEDRMILSMSVLCGYTGDEIASVCDLNPSTVRSRLLRTKEKLKKYISVQSR